MKKPIKQTVIFKAYVRYAKAVGEQAVIVITDETATLTCRANRCGTIQLLNGEMVRYLYLLLQQKALRFVAKLIRCLFIKPSEERLKQVFGDYYASRESKIVGRKCQMIAYLDGQKNQIFVNSFIVIRLGKQDKQQHKAIASV